MMTVVPVGVVEASSSHPAMKAANISVAMKQLVLCMVHLETGGSVRTSCARRSGSARRLLPQPCPRTARHASRDVVAHRSSRQTFLARNRQMIRSAQARQQGNNCRLAARFTEGLHMNVNSRFPLVTPGIATALVVVALTSAPPGAYGQELPLQLTWVDREGKALEPVGPPGD